MNATTIRVARKSPLAVLTEARSMMGDPMLDEMEPTSIVRDAAHTCGYEFGTDEMGAVVTWVLNQL